MTLRERLAQHIAAAEIIVPVDCGSRVTAIRLHPKDAERIASAWLRDMAQWEPSEAVLQAVTDYHWDGKGLEPDMNLRMTLRAALRAMAEEG